ncbi:MAG: hypothetical protein ACI39R_07680 [Lachnospiraceae bacterium]
MKNSESDTSCEKKRFSKPMKIIIVALVGCVVFYLLFVVIYRQVRWVPLLEAVEEDYDADDDFMASKKIGDYTITVFRRDFPSLGGNLSVSHYSKFDMITGKTTEYNYASADIYPKLFGYEISVYVTYLYKGEDGSEDVRDCTMELDENMEYIDGDFGSRQIYEEYFEEIQEVYQIIEDVWGFVTVKENP